MLHCSNGKCAGIYWVQRYDFFLKNMHFTNFLISNASFFHKNVIFVAAGAGKSDATKCQGFLCREGNLVLSDGRFTVKVACRACDFDGWVWPLLAPDDINIPICFIYR